MALGMRKMMEYFSFAEPEDEYYDEPYEKPTRRAEKQRREDREEDYMHDHHAEVTPIGRMSAVNTEASGLPEDLRRISTVHPSSYNDARVIGESFREGTPVIMNLTGMSEADAKRMVDFAAGLVFGMYGVIERVTNRVFLLSPATVEVSKEGAQADPSSGRFFDQA